MESVIFLVFLFTTASIGFKGLDWLRKIHNLLEESKTILEQIRDKKP